LLGYVEPVAPLLLAITFSTIGNGVLRPCLTSIATRVIGKGEQGVVLGLTQTLASLASIAAGSISGWLIEQRWLTAWGWVAAACCALALGVSTRGSARYVEVS
jgi:MFS family permease